MNEEKKSAKHDPERQATSDDDVSSLGKGDILQLEHTDPVLNAKMHLVNNAIDEIGMYTARVLPIKLLSYQNTN